MLVLAIVAYRMYNKPHRDPSSELALAINANDLFHQYEKNEEAANSKYLDKILEINGKISEVTINQDSLPVIVLGSDNPLFGVRCTMPNSTSTYSTGDYVTIKGICTGYLSDVIIVKGTLVNK